MSESENAAAAVKIEEVQPQEVVTEPKPTETAVVPVAAEQVEPPKKDRKDMTLVEIITDALVLDTEEVTMTSKMKSMLKKLSAVDKKYIHNIEAFFKIILADKQINMKDIPVVMSLVQELFLLYDSLRFKINGHDIGVLLEFLIKLMILYKVKGTDALSVGQKDEILKVLDCFIKAAVNMIELKETSKKMNSLWSRLSFSKSKPVNHVSV